MALAPSQPKGDRASPQLQFLLHLCSAGRNRTFEARHCDRSRLHSYWWGSAWWIARIKRVPFVFEVRDLWPESLVAVGMGDSNSLLHRALGRIAGFLYSRANRIVVVTPAFKDHLVKSWSIAPEKISVVENGVETDLFQPSADFASFARNSASNRSFLCVTSVRWDGHTVLKHLSKQPFSFPCNRRTCICS